MRKKLQIFNCILKPKLACKNAQFPSVERNHSSKTQPISIPVAVFRTYICQVPNETSTDEQTERDRRDDERAGVRSSRQQAGQKLAHLDELDSTTKCQRTPHVSSKFIVTKATGRRGRQQKLQHHSPALN